MKHPKFRPGDIVVFTLNRGKKVAVAATTVQSFIIDRRTGKISYHLTNFPGEYEEKQLEHYLQFLQTIVDNP